MLPVILSISLTSELEYKVTDDCLEGNSFSAGLKTFLTALRFLLLFCSDESSSHHAFSPTDSAPSPVSTETETETSEEDQQGVHESDDNVMLLLYFLCIWFWYFKLYQGQWCDKNMQEQKKTSISRGKTSCDAKKLHLSMSYFLLHLITLELPEFYND